MEDPCERDSEQGFVVEIKGSPETRVLLTWQPANGEPATYDITDGLPGVRVR